MRSYGFRLGVWVASVVSLVGCYLPNWGSIEIQELGPGETSLGIHVRADIKDRLDYDSTYELSLFNNDLHQDCNVALYFFDGEPIRAHVPVLVAGGVAPATLPGGGRLHHEWYLPATSAGDHTFLVDLQYQYLYPERGWNHLTELDRGFVLATSGCLGLRMELTLWVEAWGLAGRPSDREMRGYIRRLW